MMRLIRKLLCLFHTAAARRRVKSMGKGVKVMKKCKFTRNTEIGEGANFNGMEVTGKGRVVIGAHFHSGKECMLLTSFHNFDRGEALPYDTTTVDKDIIIEDNVWFGVRVIVLGGATIGEGAVIQAGSVVTGDIPKCAIAGGHPAKVFKYRDIEHYEKLKQEGKFC